MRKWRQPYHSWLVGGLALTATFCSAPQSQADETPTIVAGGTTLTVGTGQTESYWQLIIHDALITDSEGAVMPAYFNLEGGTVSAGFVGDSQGTGLIVGNSAWSKGIVNITGGALNVDGNMLVGMHGTGEVYQDGGNVTAGTLVIAERAGFGEGGPYSIYQLKTGTLTTDAYTYVGGWAQTYGSATFEQTGGTHQAGHIVVGRGSYGDDQYLLKGGSVIATALTIGINADGNGIGGGILKQTGGTLDINGDAILGATKGVLGQYIQTLGTAEFNTLVVGDKGIGTYSLQGGGLRVLGDEYIGRGYDGPGLSSGTFNQTGGAHTIASALILGQEAASSGTYTLSGDASTLSAAEIDVGQSGTGAFTQNDGSVAVANNLVIGRYSGSTGSYTLNAGTLKTGETHVSAQGTGGSFIQKGGSHQTTGEDGALVLGYEAGSWGAYTLQAGSLQSVWERIGLEGMGTFTQDGGANTVTTLVLGQGIGTQGDYYLNNGTLTAENAIIGGAGWGAVYQKGGTFTVHDTLTFGESGSSGASAYLSGGETTAKNATMHGSAVYITQWEGSKFTVSETLSLVSHGVYGGGYNLSGGELRANNAIISDAMAGAQFEFFQYGGTFTVGDTLTLGQGTGDNAWYNLKGGALNATNEVIGENGAANFVHANGVTNTITETLTLGQGLDSKALYLLSGTLSANNEVIGGQGEGSLEQRGGANNVTSDLILGQSLGATGWYGLYERESGADAIPVLTAGKIIVGASGTGSILQMSGKSTVNDTLTLGQEAGSSGTYEMYSGTLNAANAVIGAGGAGYFCQGLEMDGGDVSIGSSENSGALVVGSSGAGEYWQKSGVTLVNGSLIVGQNEHGNGLYAHANGSLVVTQDLTLGADEGRGNFTQSNGTATANSMTISNISTAALSGGTLEIADSLTNEGLLTLSAGVLTVGNTFTNTDDATLAIDLSTYTMGSSFITLLHSTADLDGTLKLFCSDSDSIAGITFTLLQAAGGLSEDSDLAFEVYDTTALSGYNWEFLTSGSSLQLHVTAATSPVPIPSSMLLLGSGLAMLARRRQRTRLH